MVFNSLNGLALQYLHSMFTYRNEISHYSFKDSEGKLATPLPQANYVKNTFSYSGLVLWKSLPVELRQA